MEESINIKLPKEIQDKFDLVHKQVREILANARGNIKTNISGPISLKFLHGAPRDILTDYEEAQSVCFITRYDALPVFERIKIQEHKGKYYFSNYPEARYVLNEYRPIIQNQKDSTFYQKIHKFCREKLLNKDPSKDLSIKVDHKERGDITHDFAEYLDEHYKAIKTLISNSEFAYIYNGIRACKIICVSGQSRYNQPNWRNQWPRQTTCSTIS